MKRCGYVSVFNDMDEDFESMKRGYLDGRITEERLSDALHRILALKAHMGLHKIIGCKEHLDMQRKISDKAITLVKYKDKNVLPMPPGAL